MEQNCEYRLQPLTRQEVEIADGHVCEVIRISLDYLISESWENVMDTFSEKIVGLVCLQDIDCKAVGHVDNGDVLIEVTGYVSAEDSEEME